MSSPRQPNHAIVIGSGVIGVTNAVELARRGLKVTLLERAAALGEGCTQRNGAQLSYCYVDALGAPAILPQLPRALLGRDSALRICSPWRLNFLSWAARFLAQCTSGRFARNTRAVLQLALRSRAALLALKERHPSLRFSHTLSGKVHIYDTAYKFEQAKAGMPLKNEAGCGQRALQSDELFALEPALAASPRPIVGAIYSPLDEAGDAYRFTRSLADVAQREYGVTIRTNAGVERLIIEKQRIRAVKTRQGPIEADVYVLAAGADAAALGKQAGLYLPILPMKGYSITLPATERSPRVSITDTRARIVFCRLHDEMRIAGIAELGRADTNPDPHQIQSLLDRARAFLPRAADWSADPKPWSGLRPMTPDCRPIIGATPLVNLFLNCGHGMLGWTLACGSAELLAASIFGEPLGIDTQAMTADFSLARF